ncbi:hypothetical protein ACS0TY_015792 [Phlomoides rotata]
MPENIVHLPQEIIEEILSRLPVKSLLIFRQPVIDTFEFDKIPWPQWFNLVGCCNGLVCILLDIKTFILWNPSTRTSKEFPDGRPSGKNAICWKYGFGYDESSDDYKVFSTITMLPTDNKRHYIDIVYSLNNNSWKTLKDYYDYYGVGRYANGSLHWVDHDMRIISFDLKSEVFIEIWVMKKYGVKESWVRVAILPNISILLKRSFVRLFRYGPDSDILLFFESSIVLYSSTDGVHWHPKKATKIDSKRMWEADFYTESLVSLASDDEQE